MNNTESIHKSDVVTGYEMLVLAYITLPNKQTRFVKRYWITLVVCVAVIILALVIADSASTFVPAVAGIQ